MSDDYFVPDRPTCPRCDFEVASCICASFPEQPMTDDVGEIVRELREATQHSFCTGRVKVVLRQAAFALERLVGERDEVAKQLADFMDPTLKSMRLEDGKFDMQLGGEMVQRVAAAMTEWFRESGAKNYVEMTLHAKTEPFERYQFFVQKQGDGAKTPHELRMDAEARAIAAETRAADERERCAKIAEGTAPIARGNFFVGQRDQCKKIAAAIRANVAGQPIGGG